MRHWKGFVIVWILFFIVIGAVGYLNHSEATITGNIPLTGILKEDPSTAIQVQEYDISFGIEEKLIYKLRDLGFFVDFVPKSNLIQDVEVSYFVLNSDGEVVYGNEKMIRVSEPERFDFDLDDRVAQKLEVSEGEYNLGVTISYGDFRKTFSEKFEVKEVSPLLYSLKQLFDIRLDLDSYSLDSSSDLSARVTFENFGQEDTPINLTFFIYDMRDNQLYRKDISRVVETEDLVLESFSDFSAPPGRYKLVLRTLYNVGVEDYFEQEFTIKDKLDVLPFLILGILFLVGGYFIIRGRMRDRK